MRRPIIALCALAAIGSLAGCARPSADWTYTAFDNFDPSQVSMLPSNTYDTAAADRPGSTALKASAAKVGQ